MATRTAKGEASNTYGILALAATKKIIQEEDVDKTGEFFCELEKFLT